MQNNTIPKYYTFSSGVIDLALEQYAAQMPGYITNLEKEEGRLYKVLPPSIVFNPLTNLYNVVCFVIVDEQQELKKMMSGVMEQASNTLESMKNSIPGDPNCTHDWESNGASGLRYAKCQATM